MIGCASARKTSKKTSRTQPASSDDGYADVEDEDTTALITPTAGWHSDQEQKRIDPEDGLAYTWEDFSTYYTGKYKKQVIKAYWNDCHVVGPLEPPKAAASHKKPRRRWFSRK